MFFFVKPSVIHLDCFTSDPYIHNFYPIQHSTKFYPEWWKRLPKSIRSDNDLYDHPTMKSCVGFIEYYKNSISIPLWSDLNIKVVDNGNLIWQFADKKSEIKNHHVKQFTGFLKENQYFHMKIISPWNFRTKKYVKWSWNYTTYNFHEPDNIIFLPGILDFKYQTATNINFLINTRIKKTIELHAGVPLLNITPLSDKKVKIHNHLVDSNELIKIVNISYDSCFINKYNHNKKIMQEKESKCPFGFGKK